MTRGFIWVCPVGGWNDKTAILATHTHTHTHAHEPHISFPRHLLLPSPLHHRHRWRYRRLQSQLVQACEGCVSDRHVPIHGPVAAGAGARAGAGAGGLSLAAGCAAGLSWLHLELGGLSWLHLDLGLDGRPQQQWGAGRGRDQSEERQGGRQWVDTHTDQAGTGQATLPC